jgi:hypothetical protein
VSSSEKKIWLTFDAISSLFSFPKLSNYGKHLNSRPRNFRLSPDLLSTKMCLVVVFSFMALANSLTELDSYLLDDLSGLVVDEAESEFNLLFYDDPMTFVPEEAAEPDMELSSLLFSEEADSVYETSSLLDDNLTKPCLNPDTSVDTIVTAKDCPSTLAPLNRLRPRADHGIDDHHPQFGKELPTMEDLVSEQVKRQWCSHPPSPTFDNIPIARLSGAKLKTIGEDLLPPGPLSLPLNGFVDVLEGVLRKAIV